MPIGQIESADLYDYLSVVCRGQGQTSPFFESGFHIDEVFWLGMRHSFCCEDINESTSEF
jgi:hypothetical protein